MFWVCINIYVTYIYIYIYVCVCVGPVGVELAGEIGSAYNQTAAQRKTVTLIHAGSKLLDSYKNIKPIVSDKLYDTLTKKLHVTIMFNERAELPEETRNQLYINTPIQLQLQSGNTVPSDVVILCVSGKPNTSFLQSSLPQSCFDSNGRIIVNKYLAVDGLDNTVFAIGDCASFQPGWGYYASEQGKYLGKQLINKISNKSIKTIDRLPDVMVVPLGENHGAGQLPAMGGKIIGNTLTPIIKGKGLFVSQTKSSLNIQ